MKDNFLTNGDCFNESNDFDKMMAKRKAYYKRMEDDFEFRMEQVDKKLMTINALSGKDIKGNNRYVRYKTTIIEHDGLGAEIATYEIGLRGEFTNKKEY